MEWAILILYLFTWQDKSPREQGHVVERRGARAVARGARRRRCVTSVGGSDFALGGFRVLQRRVSLEKRMGFG